MAAPPPLPPGFWSLSPSPGASVVAIPPSAPRRGWGWAVCWSGHAPPWPTPTSLRRGCTLPSFRPWPSWPSGALRSCARLALAWQGPGLGGIVALSVLLALGQYAGVVIRHRAPEVVLGQISSQAYLEHNLGPYAQTMDAVRRLPSGRRVLLLWEPREFYCLPRCSGDEILDRFWHAQWRYGPPEAILNAWRRADYTDVLVYHTGVKFLRQQNSGLDWAAWEAFQAYLRPLQTFGEAYTLYALP